MSNVLNVALLQNHRIYEMLLDDKQHTVKSVPPQSDYEVLVSVLNPRPDILDMKWNVAMATEVYIKSFLKEVSDISNYTVKTQWKFQAPFEADLKQIRDSTRLGRHYALYETSLPHIITSIEKNLGSSISNSSTLNLVVYVPPCEIAPLHIYKDKREQFIRSNIDAFISPRWGGIIIANPTEDTCLSYLNTHEPIEMYVKTNDVMQVMLYQLHILLDIAVEVDIPGVKIVELEQIAPHAWAYDAYIRRSAVLHIVTATSTLQSLIKLLYNISYIVINDEVGAAVNEANEYIMLAKTHLGEGDLMQASFCAKRAYLAAEHAFFDASLLVQLYFPDEQKYAIYIPLFLPIMVPVLTSFSTLRKLLFKIKNEAKTKED